MKSLSRYVSLISVTGLLTGGTLVAQTSATTSTSDAGRSTGSTTSPRNSASTEVSGGSDPANATNGTEGRTRSSAPGATGSTARALNNGYDTSSAAASDISSGGASPAVGTSGNLGSSSLPGTSTGASTNSATAGTSRTRNTFTGSAFSGATDPLDGAIQSGDYASRSQLAAQIEQRLEGQREAAKSLKTEGKRLQGQSKADFKTAYDEVEAREKDLKRSLKDLRSASTDKWAAARTELATNYQAYSIALARAQSQIGTSVTFPGTSSSNANDPTRAQRGSTSTPDTLPAPAPATAP